MSMGTSLGAHRARCHSAASARRLATRRHAPHDEEIAARWRPEAERGGDEPASAATGVPALTDCGGRRAGSASSASSAEPKTAGRRVGAQKLEPRLAPPTPTPARHPCSPSRREPPQPPSSRTTYPYPNLYPYHYPYSQHSTSRTIALYTRAWRK